MFPTFLAKPPCKGIQIRFGIRFLIVIIATRRWRQIDGYWGGSPPPAPPPAPATAAAIPKRKDTWLDRFEQESFQTAAAHTKVKWTNRTHMPTCRKKVSLLPAFSKPTGAKKTQKQYRRQAFEKRTLTFLSVPPPKKGTECSPQKKEALSSHDFFSLFARQDGWSHCLDCSLAHWTTCASNSPAKSRSLACVAILVTASLVKRLRPMISTTCLFFGGPHSTLTTLRIATELVLLLYSSLYSHCSESPEAATAAVASFLHSSSWPLLTTGLDHRLGWFLCQSIWQFRDMFHTIFKDGHKKACSTRAQTHSRLLGAIAGHAHHCALAHVSVEEKTWRILVLVQVCNFVFGRTLDVRSHGWCGADTYHTVLLFQQPLIFCPRQTLSPHLWPKEG